MTASQSDGSTRCGEIQFLRRHLLVRLIERRDFKIGLSSEENHDLLAFLKSLNEALAVAPSQRVHPPLQQSANTLDRRTTTGAPPRQSGRNPATRHALDASGPLYTLHALVG